MYGIAFLGVVLVAILFVAALALFWLLDHRMFVRSLRALTALSVQLALAAVYVWALYSLDSWWVNILWLLVMAVAVAYICVRRVRLPLARFLPALSLSVLCGSGVLGICVLLSIDTVVARRLFVPVMAVLVGSLLASGTLALREYIICLRHTETHRRYLQANGATHLEAIVPCVRRALRAAVVPLFRTMSSPLLVALPLLTCGMLMVGVDVVTAFVATLLLMMATYAATVLSVVMMLWLADRYLFDNR